MPVDIPNTEVDSNALAGAAIAFPLAPRDLGGPLTILQDLTNLTVEVNHFAVFTVRLSNPSGLPVSYQWLREGSPIAGATGPSYSFQVNSGDDGMFFEVQMAKIGATVMSQQATLTVVPDTTPPLALQAGSSYTNLSIVVLRYNELMDPLTGAADYLTYYLQGLVIQSASLQADGQTVILQLQDPLTANVAYVLDIMGGSDLAGNYTDLTNLTFTAGADAPRLAIALSGSQSDISWPAPSTGFVLEQADEIVIPVSAIAWTPAGGMPMVVNGRNTVSVTNGPGKKIFRLRQ
jgi:hypothetical protein